MTGQRHTGAKTGRVRLDELLVARGLAVSREQARALVLAGAVDIIGPIRGSPKPGTLVSPELEVSVRSSPSFVSRGGEKLAGALDAFSIDVDGLTAVDVGASTGGFTDCLLQRGATRVHTIDVGHGQLAWQLRQDPRVVVRERVNARFALPVDEPVGLATIDVSFISLVVVLPSVVDTVVAGGRIIGLVKPQFEARRGDVGRGGIVRDPRVRADAVGKVCLAGLELGLRVRGVAGSVLAGPKGNREVFVLFEK
jgi:23S rRNA (cytidine1920-2'-O)/16S rRNA (cytidine1409-2'-O)-methyltransferase